MRQVAFALFGFASSALASSANQPSLEAISKRFTRRTEGGIHLPIVKGQETQDLERRGLQGTIGLGNTADITYSVLVTVGEVTTPVILDTGSSDLWVISDACTEGCSNDVPLYPQETFQTTNIDISILYGDSRSGTQATGLIGKDTVEIAGLALRDHYFASIISTNTSVTETGSAGIFGLGFPLNSLIWSQVVSALSKGATISRRNSYIPAIHGRYSLPNEDTPSFNLYRPSFPTMPDIHIGHAHNEPRQSTSETSSFVLESFARLGPLLPRLVAMKELSQPMFAVSLQRNTIDIGGNSGMLSIGELPSGVSNDSLSWVPIRPYPDVLTGPSDSPAEEYPVAWEVFIDDVFIDGQVLPRSNLSSPDIALSALVDTGNSLLRGPEDVVQYIYGTIGERFSCSEPHTLAFKIGGKLFPVDPRDFIFQTLKDTVSTCSSNLVPTDPPAAGRYLFSWSLGAPFLKSVLSAYHYGNLTHPSRDPPRMGFLSTVPDDAGDLLKSAVAAASRAGGNFPQISEPAPTGSPVINRTTVYGTSGPNPVVTSITPNGASSQHGLSTGLMIPMFVLTSLTLVVWN